jgi:prepilin-type N-terminal cleavage/methylation domain-containing protein
MQPRYMGNRGFTFVELLVVMAMLGLVALIALPRIFPEGARIQAAASEVQAAFQKAQRTAVLNQHDVRVIINEAESRITIHLDRNNDGAINAGERTDAVVLPEGTAFGRGDVAALAWGDDSVSFPGGVVTFHRDGSASSEGGVYVATVQHLALGSRHAEVRAIEVARATGTVRCRMPADPDSWRGNCQ